MKKIIAVLFITLITNNLLSQGNCSLSAGTAATSVICGVPIQLNASGAGGSVLMNNNFNDGTVGTGWSSTSSAEFDNPCVPSLDGSTYLWLGPTSSAPRALTTMPYNISCTGTVCFDLRFSIQGGAVPCEGPDDPTEGVDFAYSTDGGATWNSIFYFQPDPLSGTTGAYTDWGTYCFTIPAGAISPNTMFTWTQTVATAAQNDHWGLDNINITLGGACAAIPPYHYSWVPTTGLSNPSIANPTATLLTNTTYTVYYTNGIDSCSVVLPQISVITPTADAGTLQTICLGQSTTLNGSGASNIPPVMTFANTGIGQDVPSGTTGTNTLTVSGLPYATISTASINEVCIDDLQIFFDDDLSITLICPDGTPLVLSDHEPGSNFTSTCFTPSASTPLSSGNAPYSGNFLPDDLNNNLSVFNGCSANGNWVLQITNDGFFDDATLNAWHIKFNTTTVTTPSWAPIINMTGSNTFTPTITPTVPGLTQYTLTVNVNTGCSATDTVSVMVNQVTGVSVTSTASVLCQSDSSSLNATGGTSYAWTPATGLSATNIANPVATPNTTTNYTVTVTNGNCSKIDSVKITVNPRPATDAGPNTAYCLNDSVQLNATGGADTYSWTPATGLSATNIANPIADGSTTITYTVTGTITATGCFRSDTVKVTVNPLPVAAAGIDTGFCAGANVTLNGSGGGSYSWLPATNISNSTVANPTVNPSATTDYTLTVTNSFGCKDKNTVLVTVHALPNVDAGANGFTCLGTPRQLTGTGAVNYVWSPAGSLSNPNISNPLATPTVTTTYTVIGTDAFGCVKSDLVTVGIYTVATVSMGASPASVCAGGTSTLTATGSPTSYTWSPAGTLGSVNGPSVAATPTATTTYSVQFATPGNGCIGHDSITVTILSSPAVNAGSDSNICPMDSAALNATGGMSYAWSPAAGLSNPAIANPMASPSASTHYTVTVTNSSGCSGVDSVWVFTRPNPVAGAMSSTMTGCGAPIGTVTMQTPTTGTSPYTYSLNSGSPQAGNTFGSLAAGSYTVTVTDSFACMDTASIVVTTAPNPVPGAISSTLSACTSATGTMTMQTPSVGTAPFTYVINGGGSQSSGIFTSLAPGAYTITVTDSFGCSASDTGSVQQQNAPSLTGFTPTNAICTSATGSVLVGFPTGGTAPFTFAINGGTPQSATTFTSLVANHYTITVIDVNGCTDSDTVTVAMTPSSMVLDTAMLTSTICGETTGSINVQLPTGGTGPYTYSDNGGASYQSSALFSNLGGGLYPIIVKDSHGCTASHTFYIGQNIQVNASFDPVPAIGVHPLTVSFDNHTTGANGYIWSFDNGSPNSTSSAPSSVYNTTGTYQVMLIAYHNNVACSDTAWMYVTVIDEPTVTVPNIITPNADGKNDEFKLTGFNFKSIDVTIFDRWGKKVINYSGDINTTWKADGVNDGTYFYVIKAVSIDDKETELTGNLTVIRE